jgi:hypothetical protein
VRGSAPIITKQARGGDPLRLARGPVVHDHRLQAVVTLAIDQVGPDAQPDVPPGPELPYQVLGHARREGVAAHEQRDGRGVPRQVDGGLPGGVAGADDADVAIPHRSRLAHRRAVVHAGADQ